MNDQFSDVFIELVVILHNIVSRTLMEDIEFFITEPYITSNCITNTTIAFKLGNEMARAPGINIIAVRGLQALFLARDAMLKGFPDSSVKELLANAAALCQSYKLCNRLELSYG